MTFIQQHTCISPQQTFNDIDLDKLHEPADKKLQAIQNLHMNIFLQGCYEEWAKPYGWVLAQLSRCCRVTLCDGIILGTANGGKEDCVKFLNQIIEYNEGMLTPLNFVQGTPNAVASQIGILTKNLGYNITHMHLGLAFENVLTDADMLITKNLPNNTC